MHARVVIMEMLPIDVKEAVRTYRDRVVPAGWKQENPRTAEDLILRSWSVGDRAGIVDDLSQP